MINHIRAILWKQLKDTLKNKSVLIQFVMFPFMTVIMENTIHLQDMPEHFFVNLFGVMYVGMAPLTSAASIISEEKEKKTLRVLRLCDVSAAEFLIGNAIYILSLCMAGSLVIGAAGGYQGMVLLRFLLIMFVGHCCSFLLGAAIGVAGKNQMAVTSANVPVMMILSFLPMLSIFNSTIKKVSKYIFSEQIYLLINDMPDVRVTTETGIIMACNIILIVALFTAAYRKSF